MKSISLVRISPNGRYFTDEVGNPFFWLGDTQWELFRKFDVDQALTILRNRQQKGINIILVMLTGVDIGHVMPDKNFPYVNLKGELAWVDQDPLKPNESYFQHVDALIRLGQETNQVFVVGVYHQWHANLITLQKARSWARWVANRYRDVPNLIWSMYPKASAEFIPVCREIAAGLQEGDSGSHLICVHPDPSVASSSFIHQEDWLAFNMIQTCIDYDQIYQAVTHDYHQVPSKPVVMAEGGYEGFEFDKLQTAHDIRKQAYWTVLAGGYHVYGHNESWLKPERWQEWIDSPGSQHLQILKQIITACDGWWQLIPDQSLFSSGQGEGFTLNVAARASSNDYFLAYLSHPCTISMKMNVIKTSDRARAVWLNPVDGSSQENGIYPTSGIVNFIPPDNWVDAVLLVKAV